MTDAIKNIDVVISNMSAKRRIIYFKSERRDIIERTVNSSIALVEKLENQFGEIKFTAETRFNSLVKSKKCLYLPDVYEEKKHIGKITVKDDNNPILLYITDFQVFKKQTQNFMIKAFLEKDSLKNSILLISSPELHIPDGFSECIELVQDGYISKNDILIKLAAQVREEERKRNARFFDDAELEKVAEGFVGLSESQVESVLERMYLTTCSKIKSGEYLKLIIDEKKKEIEKDPTIEFIEYAQTEMVCGLGSYSQWITDRKGDFADPVEAARNGTPSPKGVLISGVPGTGKTAAARETARIFNVPLIKFAINRIQTKDFGGSEARLARYLDRISAFGSCVMLIDEIEKVFSVNDSTHEVKRAMLGLLLDWMQMRKANVFTFITANNISSIPPELLRDGRISGRFFAFMPSRDDLCKILLLKLRNLSNTNLFSRDMIQYINKEFTSDNKFAVMFDNIASEAKKANRNLFMTGANLENLVEMTNRKKSEYNSPFSVDDYIKAMTKVALSESFVPQGQSNMADIVNMWLDAHARQYQDVSNNSVLPFSSFVEGKFKETKNKNTYDDYLRDVLKKRILGVVEQKEMHDNYIKKLSKQ